MGNVLEQRAALLAVVSRSSKLPFTDAVAAVARYVFALGHVETQDQLLHCGIIPERFDHDSSEEKLFAKAADLIVANALRHLQMKAKVITVRADEADVFASSPGYELVADAKAFRLSRTAKNQKDFKIGALSTWRKDADYAVLVGPLFQYPSSTSQIYLQAAHNNVCLLSFAHLVALMRLGLPDPESFEPLWAASNSLGEATKSAAGYWDHLNRAFSGLSRNARDVLHKSLQDEMTELERVRQTEISTLEDVANRVKEMTREQAVAELLVSLKLESRIRVIKGVSAGQLYRLVDPYS